MVVVFFFWDADTEPDALNPPPVVVVVSLMSSDVTFPPTATTLALLPVTMVPCKSTLTPCTVALPLLLPMLTTSLLVEVVVVVEKLPLTPRVPLVVVLDVVVLPLVLVLLSLSPSRLTSRPPDVSVLVDVDLAASRFTFPFVDATVAPL